MYDLLLSDRIQAAVVRRTDYRIEIFPLRILADDLQFFAAYEAAPVTRQMVLNRYPGVQTALSRLSGIISNQTMRILNRRAEAEGLLPGTVARDFLIQNGLIE